MAYALRRYAGATGTSIARVLGVSAWQACALARAGEAHWSENAGDAASVDAAVEASAYHIQQT